jgi:hypothetical protein
MWWPGKDVAIADLTESLKVAVVKGALSNLLDQEVSVQSPRRHAHRPVTRRAGKKIKSFLSR